MLKKTNNYKNIDNLLVNLFQIVEPLISSYLKNFKKNHIKPTQLEASYNSNNSIGSKGKTKTMVDE